MVVGILLILRLVIKALKEDYYFLININLNH